jgi:hypothetical protein
MRSWLLAHPADRVDSEHMALIRPQTRRKVDMQSLAVEVGPAIMARHTRAREISAVYLADIARPGRRKARAA